MTDHVLHYWVRHKDDHYFCSVKGCKARKAIENN
jgi:hypothetical protein